MRRLLLFFALLAVTVSIAREASAQKASLIGTVLDDSTERPIVDAEVRIDPLNRVVRSDSSGNFVIAEIPAGVYRVTVRALGREPLQDMVQFSATGRVERDYLLTIATNTLATVDVKAKAPVRDMHLAEFEERKRFGTGRFITQDVLEKAQGRNLSELLTNRIPGLKSVSAGGNQRVMASTRGVINFRRPVPCLVQVYVDRMLRYNGPQEKYDVNQMDPSMIAGIEYYTTAQTPAQFNNTGAGTACGTLVIWTRLR